MALLGIKDELLDSSTASWNVNKIGGLSVSFFFTDIVIYKYACALHFSIYVSALVITICYNSLKKYLLTVREKTRNSYLRSKSASVLIRVL